tara:strand:- start:7202 stop:7540 length:339 start_codon:yes stop_codon:yes gene_type:complete
MIYYRRYIGDYRRDTATLSHIDHGTYALLMDEYYAQDGALPRHISELNELCRARTKSGKDSVMRIAQRFFPCDDNGVRHNKRADIEIKIALAAIEKMRLAGIKSGRKRRGEE